MSYPTPILDQAIAARRHQNEQQRLATLEQVIFWLESKSQHYGIERAYVFGSLTRPYCFTQRSDVDVAVETIYAEHFFTAIAQLSEQIERPVDLVELSKCPFADRIRQQGILWTEKI
ncbi:nucleotidyltransferase domain-containing protein [Cronbergia sp. UHCC 0137]|uniref:nucleotidyltransferase family protein n=1 Tax=Cronbergia sp. UHCC 0137 TaxID=3110239 RepID=UPI002B217566|nr:nucleotidyltransferase domain-containing protein [Cronbergia sp. UHCC 0137]MEA5620809.1 nucleotidyltransferase domain-containing protein [Cronbergia sp. UHCC 0137]